MTATSKTATFVLVHGAWHGGWCWRWVHERLAGAGHVVICPSLAGQICRPQEEATPADMYAHVSELERLLFSHDLEDIILCGHSYGGMVITELAGVCPNRIKALVYLDAFVPLIGQSAFDVVDAPTQSRSRQAASLNGGVVPPPSAADFGVEDEHMRAWCEARFSAFPLRCFEQPCRNAADGTVARWYVKAGRDTRQSFRSVFERIKTEPTWRTAAIDTGHDMMLIDPDAVVEVLRAAAHEALR